MPNALMSPGTMRARRESTQPSLEMIRYCGMTASWVGTVMVRTTMRNRVLRPRKDNLANAKPANEHNTACPAPMVPATMRLLPRDRANGTVSKTRRTRWRKFFPGSTWGGRLVAVAESVVATTNIQYSGK
jgi:hypothetical protein